MNNNTVLVLYGVNRDGIDSLSYGRQYRMGIIMVVQTISEKEEPIELIEVPEAVPDEIIEHDSLLTIESNIHHIESHISKLDEKMILSARSMLGLTTELRTQISEIERLENNIINMHEFIVKQNDKIIDLENKFDDLELENANKNKVEKRIKTGFWARLFS